MSTVTEGGVQNQPQVKIPTVGGRTIFSIRQDITNYLKVQLKLLRKRLELYRKSGDLIGRY